jgi:hypothetical protein
MEGLVPGLYAPLSDEQTEPGSQDADETAGGTEPLSGASATSYWRQAYALVLRQNSRPEEVDKEN